MKLASAIVKLPVISVDEGEEVAIVSDLLVNRETKKAAYLSVLKTTEDVIPNFISFGDIVGISNEYIIINSIGSIRNTYSNTSASSELESCLSIRGRLVIDVSGEAFDTISDYSINTKTGDIEKLILNNGNELDGGKLVTLSAKFIFVNVSNEEAAITPDDGTMAYLVGKTVSSDIVNGDGSFTITSGTVLSQELIVEAAKYDLLLNLTMAV